MTPDELERLLRHLERELQVAQGRFGRADLYRWAWSGISGVRSQPVGTVGRSGHADPVPGATSQLRRVEQAARHYQTALTALRAANRLLVDEDGPTDPPAPLGKNHRVREVELVEARQMQAKRISNGGGFGSS